MRKMGNHNQVGYLREPVRILKTEDCWKLSDEFWSFLYLQDVTTEEIESAISTEEILEILKNKPANIFFLIQEILAILKVSMEQPVTVASVDKTTSFCVRLLTRLMSTLCNTSIDSTLYNLFWDTQPAFLFLIAEIKDEEATHKISNGREKEETDTAIHSTEPHIVKQILKHLMYLLFNKYCYISPVGESIELTPRTTASRSYIWKNGIGSVSSDGDSTSIPLLKNRTEVIHCLITCLSEPLFHNAEQYMHLPQPWSNALLD
ncbi:hypothetical protein IE077_001595, partial [Cardiosporidium cionae]